MWHRIWIGILANADDAALAGAKVRIGGAWHSCEEAGGFRNLETGELVTEGRITEIRLPIHEQVGIGSSSECGR